MALLSAFPTTPSRTNSTQLNNHLDPVGAEEDNGGGGPEPDGAGNQRRDRDPQLHPCAVPAHQRLAAEAPASQSNQQHKVEHNGEKQHGRGIWGRIAAGSRRLTCALGSGG